MSVKNLRNTHSDSAEIVSNMVGCL